MVDSLRAPTQLQSLDRAMAEQMTCCVSCVVAFVPVADLRVAFEVRPRRNTRAGSSSYSSVIVPRRSNRPFLKTSRVETEKHSR